MQVTYASSLAVEGVSGAASLAHEAVRVPADAVTKPIRQLASYFGAESERHEEGHAMQPLLSSLSAQPPRGGGAGRPPDMQLP